MSDILADKRVVVMGFVRQGQALARWLPTIGAHVTVTDLRAEDALDCDLTPYREAGVDFVLGEHPESLLDDAALLCVSGGVPLEAPLVQAAVKRGILLSNDAQLFLERCPAPVIGITGSAGKTTTTILVGRMCAADGRTTHVGGNIGDVLLDVLPRIAPTDTVVMELSSFQLDLLTVSPHYGAILNVTPNHLDRHGTMEAYTRAKSQLIADQGGGDVAILGLDDPGSAALASLVAGQTIYFSGKEIVADGAYLDNGQVMVIGAASPDGGSHGVVRRDAIPLRGDHNVMNVLAACAIAGAAGMSVEAMRKAVRDFEGIPHRLEVVRELDGVTWVNNSIATAPERVIAALRSYDQPLVLLLGGKDKNLPWEPMLRLAMFKAHTVIAFGDAGPMIFDMLTELLYETEDDMVRMTTAHGVMTLEKAVSAAFDAAQAGDVVLLSPGGTSYDAYTDFEERGEHFRALVKQL